MSMACAALQPTGSRATSTTKAIAKALHLCAELRVWWKGYTFLHLSPTKFDRKWPQFRVFGYKISIQQHFKSRLFWKTKAKCQEAENSRISGDPWRDSLRIWPNPVSMQIRLGWWKNRQAQDRVSEIPLQISCWHKILAKVYNLNAFYFMRALSVVVLSWYRIDAKKASRTYISSSWYQIENESHSFFSPKVAH